MSADQLLDADPAGLFRQHHADLVRLAVLLVRDQPTAEDVVQDVFALPHVKSGGAARPGEQVAYIRVCVLNGCRSVLRRRAIARRAGRLQDLVDQLYSPSAEAETIRAECRQEVLTALARRPARRREVLVLRYSAGLSEGTPRAA